MRRRLDHGSHSVASKRSDAIGGAAVSNEFKRDATFLDWTYLARGQEVLEAFAPFVFDFLDVPVPIRGAEEVYEYPIVDRDPTSQSIP
jgi:hypothetical protein